MMTMTPLRSFLFAVIAAALAACASAPLTEYEPDPRLVRFAPQDGAGSATAIDYTAYDELLSILVFDVGPSDRTPAPAPLVATGSRIKRQNNSRYRLEGNRLFLSVQPKKPLIEVTGRITDYFESVASSAEFAALPSDDQLAFWINFHNMLLIEQIATRYPFQRLDDAAATGPGEGIYDVAAATVGGVDLSLNDIKYGIVYPNWDDPRVVYGFFTGAVGGPNIRKSPYQGSSVFATLESNGREFVNSLRGVDIDEDVNRISMVLKDLPPFFDGSWDAAIEHLIDLANAKTRPYLSVNRPIRATVYDWSIADLSYGDTPPPIGQTLINDGDGVRGRFDGVSLSPQVRDFVQRVEERKFWYFKSLDATVTIEDVEEADDTSAASNDGDDEDAE